MNLANKISILRMMLVPFFVAAIVYSNFTLALAIFVICMLTDAADGYIARSRSQQTRLGSLLDPMADKLLLISGYISLSMITTLPNHLRFPPYVPLIVISRDVLIVLGCLVIYLSKGKMDIKPTILGKVTTFFQMIGIVAILIQFPFSKIIWNAMVALTCISGLDYLRAGSKMVNENH